MNKKSILKLEKALLITALVGSIIGGALFGYITSEIKNYSGIHNLKKFQPSIPTRLYDINGELIAELFQKKRDLIRFEDLPKSLINAFLAAEDHVFYEHFGINPLAIIRALWKNALASIQNLKITIVQGGSTITQQLAKRLFTKSERTMARKAFEAILALQIEKKFSKEEILEMYFNQIYLGHGCHGIATAGKFYFEKNIKYLSVAESSILAALPSKPNGFSPLKYPKRAYIKNKDTLKRMINAGYLTKDQYNKILNSFWPKYLESISTEFPTKTALTKNIDKAPYFTDYVRQILLSRYGKDIVYNEGLKVYTTLNLKRQRIGQKHLQLTLKKQDKKSSKFNKMYDSAVDRGLIGTYGMLRMLFSLPGVIVKNDITTIFKKKVLEEMVDAADGLSLLTGASKTNKMIESFRAGVSKISSNLKVEGALIAVEPKTGYITTLIGGSKYEVSNQYNRAVQARRQPGSSFKPFVYGSAIAAGRITTATVLPDTPIVDIDAQGDTWTPGNYEGTFSGMVPVSSALPASINIISVRIYDLMGPDKIVNFASKMLKIAESRFSPNPSLALGSSEVTPLEMATAYSIYANDGKDVIPFAIRYVVDRDGTELDNTEETVGNIIATKEMNNTIQVIKPEVAWIMTDLMKGVIDGGTAFNPIRREVGFRQKAAGKTGTTSNWTDAWFCGFTSDIATIVWVGYDRPFMSLGPHQAGSTVAAPLWANYMKEIYNGMPDSRFSSKPPGVYPKGVCLYTGMIPGPNCKKISGGYGLKKAGRASKKCDGVHYKMKSILQRYMEKEGLIKKKKNE